MHTNVHTKIAHT